MRLAELCKPHVLGEYYWDILARLLRMAPPGEVVEIGLGCGLTHLVLHQVAGKRRVIGVDNLFDQALYNVDPIGLSAKIYALERAPYFLIMDSVEAARFIQLLPVAFLFVDGDHRYSVSRLDMERYFPTVIEGGIIAVHDAEQPDVIRALDEMKPEVYEECTWTANDGAGTTPDRLMWTGIKKGR